MSRGDLDAKIGATVVFAALVKDSKTPARATVHSVRAYLNYLERHATGDRILLFRGQREDWALLPKVARLKPRGGRSLIKNERDILNHFKRTAISFLPPSYQQPDEWDWLSIAQHHGLPTRLLDWTGNALAGLWFAVREPPTDTNRPGSVWMLTLSPDDPTDIDGDQDPMQGSSTHVFAPRHVTTRIRSQDGMFTCHKYIEGKGSFLPLENIKRFKPKLDKVHVEPRAFPQIRRELSRLGVNGASLFPDLDGLSEYLEWRYARAGDEKE